MNMVIYIVMNSVVMNVVLCNCVIIFVDFFMICGVVY